LFVAAAIAAVWLAGCGDDDGGVSYGALADTRDGRSYKTVKTGNQTWMAENLNYDGGNGLCYGGDEAKCNEYGRLYEWDEAQAVCPEGWHLPTRQEWNALAAFVGDSPAGKENLKSTKGWTGGNGTNASGFSALPAGFRNGGSFDNAGSGAYWWVATKGAGTSAWYRFIDDMADKMAESTLDKSDALSVRCVKG
jgi:uncharacterized protein (TIGR02145 family)